MFEINAGEGQGVWLGVLLITVCPIILVDAIVLAIEHFNKKDK